MALNLWHKISSIGQTEEMKPDEIRSVHLVNRMIFIGTVTTFVVAPLIAMQGNWIGVWSQIVTGFLLIIGFLFSVYRRYNGAMVYILLVLMGNITLAALLTPEILVEFFLIPLSIAASAVLKSNRVAIIMFAACMVNYFLIEYYNDIIPKQVHMSEELINTTYLIDAGLIFALTFTLFIVLRKTNTAFESRIIAQKEHIELQNYEITQSITYAKRIQMAILPPAELARQYLPKSFMLYKPKDIVAGDFYFMEPAEDLIVFAAADCTGHGVPGAMVSVICNNALNRSVREFKLRKPEEILDKTRELVIREFEKSTEDVQDGMDISLCSYNSKTMELQWAGANNPLWIIRKGSNEIEELKPDKQPIAAYDIIRPFTGHTIQMHPGDTIYVFTDGYQDQFGGERGKKYRPAQLRETLVSLSKKDISEQQVILNQDFDDWMGEFEQVDDVCLIGVVF
ncbi:SpoIIE family protein phosphatase [bacterium AH-315-B15]|nr:SpoIIE family protein phosphatase [bacterium AH-315-B15]MBN4082072.1 SpoIIE family protein phosphatase [bacterium AH-315-B15]